MAQYIDKDALVAKIEKLMYAANLEADIASTGECFNENIANAKYQLCNYILGVIKTLEVKEVDLKKLGEVARHLIAVKEHIEDMRLDKEEWFMLEKIGYPETFKAQKEEPVSEELEEAMQHNAPDNIGIDDLLYWRNGFITGAKWQKEKEYTCYEEAFEDGAKWKVENLWKPADGDDLPEIDREVVAFQETFPTNVDVPSLFKIVIAHRPNPDGFDGKSLTTGEVEHYTPKTYDKGGWNIPDIKWWLDYDINELLCREK